MEGHHLEQDGLSLPTVQATPRYCLSSAAAATVVGVRRKDLRVAVPSMSMDSGHVVCIMSKAKPRDSRTWPVAVDMGKRALEEVAPISFQGHEFIRPSYFSCTLSKYMSMD
ncbi:hypothetical protein SEVIR_9G518901v4 [Setaria viridis]